MTRKEEIIYAALELAAEHGPGAVTLSRIADRVGIKKPSLYNHFASKEELVKEMYAFLREQAKTRNTAPPLPADFGDASLEEILLGAVRGYMGFLSDGDILRFFKVLYSERSTSPAAAQIMLEETEKMTAATRSLFYALVVRGKMKNEDVDTAALCFAMAVHSLVDRQMDMMTAGTLGPEDCTRVSAELEELVRWFGRKMEVGGNE
ncbi:MAG: TetR/AcrR family transcriptional regulator [Ruminococcus sp.]|nr:TetR/AcrR family transcriptional regulator [Ruminococcus sp.]